MSKQQVSYIIRKKDSVAEIGNIENHSYNCEHQPYSGFSFTHDREDNFYIELWTNEKNIKAI